jgi:hypothetical protein
MTDLEYLETAIRRVLSNISIQPHGSSIEEVLLLLADEIADVTRVRKTTRAWADAQTKTEKETPE